MLIHIPEYLVSTKLSKAFYCECRHIIKEWIHRAYIFDSIWYINVRIPGELFYYVTAHVPCAKRSHNNVESKL